MIWKTQRKAYIFRFHWRYVIWHHVISWKCIQIFCCFTFFFDRVFYLQVYFPQFGCHGGATFNPLSPPCLCSRNVMWIMEGHQWPPRSRLQQGRWTKDQWRPGTKKKHKFGRMFIETLKKIWWKCWGIMFRSKFPQSIEQKAALSKSNMKGKRREIAVHRGICCSWCRIQSWPCLPLGWFLELANV